MTFLSSLALILSGMSENVGCGENVNHLQPHVYPELDHGASSCFALNATTSTKLQIIYSITNAVCSDEVNHFKVMFGEPTGPFGLITFTFAWYNGLFNYKQCPTITEINGTTFQIACALECANDFRIVVQWMPGSHKRSFSLCEVKLSTPVRDVVPKVG